MVDRPCEACEGWRREASLRHGALRGQLRVLVSEWRQRARGDAFTRAGGFRAAADGLEDALTADGAWRAPTDPVTGRGETWRS